MSGKEPIDPESIPKYKNNASQNLNAERQIQKRIDDSASKSSKSSFMKYKKELKEKNSFFARSKINETHEDLCDQYVKYSNSAYNSNFTMMNNDNPNEEYCQKCPRLKNHCTHKIKKENLKDKFSYPIVSNSTYGWLPPIDLYRQNYNLNSNTKLFYDSSHL